MFIVCRKLSANRSCVLICRSIRDGKKVIQKTIKYCGVAHGKQQQKDLIKQAKAEIAKLNALQITAQKRCSSSKVDNCDEALLSNMVERFRVSDGYHSVFGPIFDELNLAPLFTKIRYNQLRDVVVARVAHPVSKLHTAKLLKTAFLRPLSEDQIYRLMDELTDLTDKIKAKVFEATLKKSPQQSANLLLFDVTTLYFESQKNDDLRDFGYSKDHKIGETQVVLALATNATGLPIGYHLFKRNTAETSTLLSCLNEWKTILNIKDVIIVADRAMMSEDNLETMESANFKYVVASKLKKLPKELRESILKRQQEIQAEFGDETIFIQEHIFAGRRLVVQYSKKRAEKDAKDRERLIEKLKKKLNESHKTTTRKLITNNGYLKFVTEEKKGQAILNEQKIEEDKRWDGLHGIITNDTKSEAIALLSRYRRLWVIEESFRINKHNLSMRPVYHFTQKRIEAHVLICYLAFAITRYAQQKINVFDNSISIEDIRSSLGEIEASILEDTTTGHFYMLPSNMGKEAKMIYRAMGIERCKSPIKYAMNQRNVV